MALDAAIVWEIRPGAGNANNGGGFKAGATGTDYSQQNAAQFSGSADMEAHASTQWIVKPGAHTPTAADVGNVVKITAGTGWTAGYYEITDQDGTYWTLAGAAAPSAAGNANKATWYMGGACASIANIYNIIVAGNFIWYKSGTDTLTSNYSFAAGTMAAPIRLHGYNSTRGDLTYNGTWDSTHDAYGFLDTTNFPKIRWASGTNNIGVGNHWEFMSVDIEGSRNGNLFSPGTGSFLLRVKSNNTNTGTSTTSISSMTGGNVVDCDLITAGANTSYTCTATPGMYYACRITSANGGGISSVGACLLEACLFYDMKSGQIAANGCINTTRINGCTFDNIAGTCIKMAGSQTASGMMLCNVQATNCATFCDSNSQTMLLMKLGVRRRDVTTTYTGWYDNDAETARNDITTAQDAADEYESVANNDYRLKTAASGKGAGYPPYLDTGCWQRQEPAAGGGGPVPIMQAGRTSVVVNG